MNKDEKLFEEEAADLFFHYLILLRAKNKSLEDIVQVLEKKKKIIFKSLDWQCL